jgi:hypothetical protein
MRADDARSGFVIEASRFGARRNTITRSVRAASLL